MKFKIVLIRFPFDDLKGGKLRPALCLTGRMTSFNHIIFAAITSNLNNATEPTDIIIDLESSQIETGLKTTSVLKTHRLITANENIIEKVIGILPENYHAEVNKRLGLIFMLNKQTT